MANTITVNHEDWVIVDRDTPAEMRAKGLNNVADLWESDGIVEQLALRKIRGRVIHIARLLTNGRYTIPVRIPGMRA